MFPCESSFSGYEVQGHAGEGNGTGGLFARREIHFSSDIAYAAWQLWQASGDRALLAAKLEPMIRGVASFWASRVECEDSTHDAPLGKVDDMDPGQQAPGKQPCHIRHVMPPDEYHEPVDDNAMTNYGASTILRLASEAAVAAGRQPGANWTSIAKRLFVPYDATRRYHPEYVNATTGAFYQFGTKVKQADVILMGFPYPPRFSQAVRRMPRQIQAPNLMPSVRTNLLVRLPSPSPPPFLTRMCMDMGMCVQLRARDLEAYKYPTTDFNGPAMSWSMFAIGWLAVGNETAALENFRRGYANAQPPFGVWTELPAGGTVNFITGAGGFLQSVLFGYGGLRIQSGHLEFEPPAPPQGAAQMVLKGVHYRGNRLEFTVSQVEVSVALLSAESEAEPLVLVDGARGMKSRLVAGHAPLRSPRGALTVRPDGNV